MALGAFVLGYDALAIVQAGETLSGAHRRFSQGGTTARLCLLGIHAVVAAHLYGKMPRRYDPFIALGVGVETLLRCHTSRLQTTSSADGPLLGGLIVEPSPDLFP